jgi:hypothetical protein
MILQAILTVIVAYFTIKIVVGTLELVARMVARLTLVDFLETAFLVLLIMMILLSLGVV